jgi:hypothetical protein
MQVKVYSIHMSILFTTAIQLLRAVSNESEDDEMLELICLFVERHT